LRCVPDQCESECSIVSPSPQWDVGFVHVVPGAERVLVKEPQARQLSPTNTERQRERERERETSSESAFKRSRVHEKQYHESEATQHLATERRIVGESHEPTAKNRSYMDIGAELFHGSDRKRKKLHTGKTALRCVAQEGGGRGGRGGRGGGRRRGRRKGRIGGAR
jgi:hypothetical protein